MLRDPCQTIWPLLSATLDDELPAAEHAAVIQHLGSCAACKARLSEYEEIGRLVALPVPAPPENLLGALRLRLAMPTPVAHAPDQDWTMPHDTQEQPYDGPP